MYVLFLKHPKTNAATDMLIHVAGAAAWLGMGAVGGGEERRRHKRVHHGVREREFSRELSRAVALNITFCHFAYIGFAALNIMSTKGETAACPRTYMRGRPEDFPFPPRSLNWSRYATRTVFSTAAIPFSQQCPFPFCPLFFAVVQVPEKDRFAHWRNIRTGEIAAAPPLRLTPLPIDGGSKRRPLPPNAQKKLLRASRRVAQVLVPALAKDLDDLEETPNTSAELVQEMHLRGINVR